MKAGHVVVLMKTGSASAKVGSARRVICLFIGRWMLDVPPSVAAATYGETSERLPRRSSRRRRVRRCLLCSDFCPPSFVIRHSSFVIRHLPLSSILSLITNHALRACALDASLL